MKRCLSLVLVLILSGCVRKPPAAPEGDTSIAFPSFFEREAIEVGSRGEPYEMDGVMLRAVMVAANDFLPPGASNPPCRNRQEAQRYRVIRQGDIIFVSIQEDPAFCGARYPALDSGAMYAVSADGRILRRVNEGQPGGDLPLEPPDAGHRKVQAVPGVPPALDDIWNDPSRPMPPEWRDGGSGPGHPGSSDAGAADADGGSPTRR